MFVCQMAVMEDRHLGKASGSPATSTLGRFEQILRDTRGSRPLQLISRPSQVQIHKEPLNLDSISYFAYILYCSSCQLMGSYLLLLGLSSVESQ